MSVIHSHVIAAFYGWWTVDSSSTFVILWNSLARRFGGLSAILNAARWRAVSFIAIFKSVFEMLMSTQTASAIYLESPDRKPILFASNTCRYMQMYSSIQVLERSNFFSKLPP